jgi:hypothetical protein
LGKELSILHLQEQGFVNRGKEENPTPFNILVLGYVGHMPTKEYSNKVYSHDKFSSYEFDQTDG